MYSDCVLFNSCMHNFANFLHLDKEALRYALKQPRVITYFLFDRRQTFILMLITLSINAIEYVFFLSSMANKEELGDRTKVAGLGFFQTISTRNAGLQIMNLRIANEVRLLHSQWNFLASTR